MKKTKGRRKRGHARAPRVKKKVLRVPPPESELWPEEFRGERWKPAFAILFAGHCQLCAYASPQPRATRLLAKCAGLPRTLLCTNHPDCPGELLDVLPTETCRNFKAHRWRRTRPKQAEPENPPVCIPGRGSRKSKAKGKIRRIYLTHGLYAMVDAADFKELNKYKWCATRRAGKVYAMATINGKPVLMHRFLMRPRKGYQVDHIDGNGLNNCRWNLRICTAAQNQANRRPCGGSSRFVGVCRRGDKWEAWFKHKGEWFTLGRYDDEIQAAKARDRKAYAVNGEHAYLNFPDDFGR